jgi:general secretion pathway protein C
MIIAAMQSLPIPSDTNPWLIRLLTFLLAALAAGSLLYWVLKWQEKAQPPRNTVAQAQTVVIDSDKVARLLGAGPLNEAPVATVQTNYKLLGVIAQGSRGAQGTLGSALIAVDGTAKPYRVGEVVADGLVLQSVKARSAILGRGEQSGSAITLELPPLPGMPAPQ